MNAGLKVLEWWNQPPTSPLQQSGQTSEVLKLVMDGKWPLTNWGAHLGCGSGCRRHLFPSLRRLPRPCRRRRSIRGLATNAVLLRHRVV